MAKYGFGHIEATNEEGRRSRSRSAEGRQRRSRSRSRECKERQYKKAEPKEEQRSPRPRSASASSEEEFGPSVPEDFADELQAKEDAAEEEAARKKQILTVSYRRPKRFRQNQAEQLHPLDEKRLLSEVKLKENEKREAEIKKNMKNLLSKVKSNQ